jgi:hypothetical protein
LKSFEKIKVWLKSEKSSGTLRKGISMLYCCQQHQMTIRAPSSSDMTSGFFYVFTVHLDAIKVYYSPTNAQVIVLKTILKLRQNTREIQMKTLKLQ